jgi:ABC-type nitrate/sulfonate/bicarbonate transport system permease component
MLIYRGAGFLTLLTPIATLLLLMWLWPDPTVAKGTISLARLLLGFGIGAALNVVLGFLLNRGARVAGEHARHHFFFLPMQWPSLAIVVACGVVALLR